jgi:hypothetical protein
MCQATTKRTKQGEHKPTFPYQGPPKYFGIKVYRLATLFRCHDNELSATSLPSRLLPFDANCAFPSKMAGNYAKKQSTVLKKRFALRAVGTVRKKTSN